MRRTSATAGAIFALAVALSSFVRPRLASADEPAPAAPAKKETSSLSWTRRAEAGDACIGVHDLATKVEAILHRGAIVSAAEADLSIEGHVEKKAPKGWRADIDVAKSSGEKIGTRELTTDEADCHALDDTVSLAIALMIDPDALSSPHPPDVEPTPPPPDPKIIVREKTVYVPVEKPAPPEKKKKKPVHVEGYLGGAAGLGITPFGGGALSGIVVDPPWFGAFEATLSILESTRSLTGGDPRMQFWRLEGSAYFDPLAGNIGLFEGSIGIGGQAGFVASSSNGADPENEHVHPLVGAAARGRAGLWIYPLTISLGATVSVPILRETYTTTAMDGTKSTVFDSAPVGGTFDLSLGVRFPRD
jgi:hypothetical protein